MSELIVATIGASTAADAVRAGAEASEEAVRQLDSMPPRLAIVFGSSWFDPGGLLEGIHSVLGPVPLIGQSTAGEIGPQGPLSHTCLVVLIAGEALHCSVGCGEAIDEHPREAGQRAAYAAMRNFQGGRSGFLLFGDGLVTNYTDVVRGIQEVLGTGALIVGGMAGDDLRFAQTYQFVNTRVVSRAVVGALLGGAIGLGVGMEHGFAPISKPRRITRAHANILYELDRQPAASVYEEYFGTDVVQRMRTEGVSRQGIAYPLGIQNESASHWLLRNVVVFQPDGSLSCSGEIAEGGWLQLMIGSRELALEAASKAAQQAVRSLNRIACVLVFDSIVRRALLGPRYAAMEIASIREAIGPATPLAGCYTYGEQAPLESTAGHGSTVVQTGSVLVVALGS